MNSKNTNIVNKCHDIQVSFGDATAAEYDNILEIGMMIRLSLHIRGLALIDYETLKLVAQHYLQIPSPLLKYLIYALGDINFVKIDSEGNTIRAVLPTVPYFDDAYKIIGDYASTEKKFSESEQLTIEILSKLSDSPLYKSTLYELGAEKKLVNQTLLIGSTTGFLNETRARGKDIILSPAYFMDNADLYTDIVAASGASQIKRINTILKGNQGWPLNLIIAQNEICGSAISAQEIQMLKRLAQDGAVKPPSIETTHSGTNYFMFTPTPGIARLHPGKREIYERAMAMVAAVRQGQLLPNKFAIKSPSRLLSALRDRGYINASTEAAQQYKQLSIMRMCVLENTGSGFHKLRLVDMEENREALDIAISLVQGESTHGTEINEEARFILQQDQVYIDSLRSSINIRKTENIPLSEEQEEEIANLLLGGIK